MRICVVGNGGREQAMMRKFAENGHAVLSRTPEEALSTSAALYVIGSEAPLVDGLADQLREQGKVVFGPGTKGAKLEGSKIWMKQFLANAGVPTARFSTFSKGEERQAQTFIQEEMEAPWVIKTDYLAAGKGVLVTSRLHEAVEDAKAKLQEGSIVIEEGLKGYELSVMVVTDGKNYHVLPLAQDYKRLQKGDEGPNTGGMGSYAPVPVEGTLDFAIRALIIERTLAELAAQDISYRGVLYFGLMITPDGPKVLEIKVRFGDPESQCIFPLFASDPAELLFTAAMGKITSAPEFSHQHAVCVVLAAEGYPEGPQKGDQIYGIDSANKNAGIHVLEAGVETRDGKKFTNGGRVLNVVAVGPSLDMTRDRAYKAIDRIKFRGMQYRDDIAELSL